MIWLYLLVPWEVWFIAACTDVMYGGPSPFRGNQSALVRGQVLPPEAGTQCPVLGIVLAHVAVVYREGHQEDRRQERKPKSTELFPA